MENDNNAAPEIGGLLVSRMVTDDLQQPRFIYREKRIRPEDSGWRIFTGMESEEYLDDPQNCSIYHPDTVIAIDPSIGPLLQSGLGSVFEKNEANFWERVDDFPLEDDFMTVQPLDGGWEMGINNLFEREADEDETFFTTGDKSVRVSIWEHEDVSREDLIARIRAEIALRDEERGDPLERFDLREGATDRLGYMVVEQDEWRAYQVIYGWTVTDAAFAFVSFYFDDPADQEWALETWRSLKPLTRTDPDAHI